MRKCPRCGAKVPEADRFCTSCGAPMPASRKSSGSSKTVIVLCIVALIALLVLIGTILYVTGVFDGLIEKFSDNSDTHSYYYDDDEDEDEDEDYEEPETKPTQIETRPAPTEPRPTAPMPAPAPETEPTPAPTEAPTEPPVKVYSSDAKITTVYASSSLSEDGMTHSPDRLLDGDLSRAWAEGVSGYGEGESVTFCFDDTYQLKGFSIWSGYQKSDYLFRANCRPSLVTVTTPNGYSQQFTLADVMGQQSLTFSNMPATNELTITINGVYTGSAWNDTVISEIEFF